MPKAMHHSHSLQPSRTTAKTSPPNWTIIIFYNKNAFQSLCHNLMMKFIKFFSTWMQKQKIQMMRKYLFLMRPSKTFRSLWILRAFISLNMVICTKPLNIIVKWRLGSLRMSMSSYLVTFSMPIQLST